jgi:putative transcriptional regulator
VKNKLHKIRKDHQITQTQLADKVLTTRQTIYLIEKDKVTPSLELAFKLAQYFEISIEDIFIYSPKSEGSEDDLFRIH